MATTENALDGLQEILELDFPTYLREVELEFTDGIELHNLTEISWEEYEDGVGLQLPGAMLIAEDETDAVLRDQIFECRITMVFALADSNKRNVTKKKFRYGRALRRMFRPAKNRSLRGRVISVKVG